MQGWGALFKEGYATDSTSAIAVTIALFIAPARPPVFDESTPADMLQMPTRPGSQAHAGSRPPMPRCLDWETAVKIPWGIILLLGGGFAIADAFDASGLNHWLGCRECTEALAQVCCSRDINYALCVCGVCAVRAELLVFQDLPPALAVLAVCFVITFTTEFTSNTATCTIAMPVLSSLSQSMMINPMVLLVPGTYHWYSASCLPSQPVDICL